MSRALEILAGLVLEDGRRWGDSAYDFQWADATAILERKARRFYLTRPRGASKTTDLGAVCVAALIDQLPPQSRSYAAAVDRDQARLIRDAILGFVSRDQSGELGRTLSVDSWVIANRHTGASIEILAADGAGAWGLRPHLLIVDEFAQWPDTPGYEVLWNALYSSLGKVPDSRLIILTTAGTPRSHAHKLLQRAKDASGWYVHEVPGPTPWISPVDLAEDEAELAEWEYARLHLNRWEAAADRLVRPDDLAACLTHEGQLPARWGERYVVTLDVGIVHDHCVAAVCHGEPIRRPRQLPELSERSVHDPAGFERFRRLEPKIAAQLRGEGSYAQRAPEEVRVVLDHMLVWAGTKRAPVNLMHVEDAVLWMSRQYNLAPVYYDPSQAIRIADGLAAVGVHTEAVTFTTTSNSERAKLLHRLIRQHALSLPSDDPELVDELQHVRLLETSPNVFRLDHEKGRHDDRAICLAMAAQVLSDPVAHQPQGFSKIRDRRLSGSR